MKIWSISTSLRNPNRIPQFLSILNMFNGQPWQHDTQIDYYVELIRAGFVNPKNIDPNNLPSSNIAARQYMCNYFTDPAMRGRTAVSPLKKFGYIEINNDIIYLTTRGTNLLNGAVTLRDSLLEGLIEWEHSANFNPFIATLYFIQQVNNRSGNNTGISYYEFNIFVKTLTSYTQIDNFVNILLQARTNSSHLNQFESQYVANFTNFNNSDDYIDNDIKYFCLTNLILNRTGNNFLNLNYTYIHDINNIITSNIV